MNEISSLVIKPKNKMCGLEMDNGNSNKVPQEGGMRNPNQLRRPFYPQLMRRDRRNDEQPIHSRVRNNDQNNLVEEKTNERYTNNTKDIHMLQEEI
jgi:hypothetical protein